MPIRQKRDLDSQNVNAQNCTKIIIDEKDLNKIVKDGQNLDDLRLQIAQYLYDMLQNSRSKRDLKNLCPTLASLRKNPKYSIDELSFAGISQFCPELDSESSEFDQRLKRDTSSECFKKCMNDFKDIDLCKKICQFCSKINSEDSKIELDFDPDPEVYKKLEQAIQNYENLKNCQNSNQFFRAQNTKKTNDNNKSSCPSVSESKEIKTSNKNKNSQKCFQSSNESKSQTFKTQKSEIESNKHKKYGNNQRKLQNQKSKSKNVERIKQFESLENSDCSKSIEILNLKTKPIPDCNCSKKSCKISKTKNISDKSSENNSSKICNCGCQKVNCHCQCGQLSQNCCNCPCCDYEKAANTIYEILKQKFLKNQKL